MIFRITSIAALLLVAAPLLAQEPKVAYVDIDRVLAEAKTVQNKMETMTEQVERLRDEVTAKRRLVSEKEGEVRKQKDVLSESELSKKRDEIKKLSDDIKTMEDKYRTDLQRMDETFFEPTIKRIGFTIQDVAREKKLDLVLRGEAVLYGANTVDLTEDIIRRLNAEDAASTATKTSQETKAGDGDVESGGSSAGTTRQRPVDRQQE